MIFGDLTTDRPEDAFRWGGPEALSDGHFGGPRLLGLIT